jgi:hypothetical protein
VPASSPCESYSENVCSQSGRVVVDRGPSSVLLADGISFRARSIAFASTLTL